MCFACVSVDLPWTFRYRPVTNLNGCTGTPDEESVRTVAAPVAEIAKRNLGGFSQRYCAARNR